jgi:hypothetical protein
MALAKRKARPESLFVAAKQLTPSAGHPLNHKPINSLMGIALTHRYRRTPQANIVTTRVRGMMRASVRQPDGV